jgi:TPR repeat protein
LWYIELNKFIGLGITLDLFNETKRTSLHAQSIFCITALELYENGLAMLNVTRPKKLEAYNFLQRAGELGHSQARVLVAWAQLLGSPMTQDIEAAKQAFQELVELGVPDAHMVSSVFKIHR